MQTQPSTPAPTVAPCAPLRSRLIKRSKSSTPASLSSEDKAALLPKLKAIRTKHAPRALHLAHIAQEVIVALQELEETMDEDTRALYPHYVCDLQDYKLTFGHEYPERAEEYDNALPRRRQARIGGHRVLG